MLSDGHLAKTTQMPRIPKPASLEMEVGRNE